MQSFWKKAFQKDFPVENECMRNASRRKALYQWCPTCSHIKLHTIQQAIIFVCFFFSRVSAHSSDAVQLLDKQSRTTGQMIKKCSFVGVELIEILVDNMYPFSTSNLVTECMCPRSKRGLANRLFSSQNNTDSASVKRWRTVFVSQAKQDKVPCTWYKFCAFEFAYSHMQDPTPKKATILMIEKQQQQREAGNG